MIGTVVQKGSNVYVYDERGSHLFTRDGERQGFTSTTVFAGAMPAIFIDTVPSKSRGNF